MELQNNINNDEDFVSMCLITYNQEKYIAEALSGIINQDYKNFEIVISDDNSIDDTYDIIKSFYERYKHSFRIIINKNIHNLGIAGNINKAIELCSGQYIILNAGDDTSLPNRIKISVKTIKESRALSVTFNSNIMDSVANVSGLLIKENVPSQMFYVKDYIKCNLISNGSTRIINRKLIELFGYITKDCPTEDSVFNFRAILAGGLAFCNVPVANYRIHDNNISHKQNLMLKFDPIKIYNQYTHDLEVAYKLNLVTSLEYHKLKKRLFHYKNWEVTIRKLYSTNSIISKIYILITLMFSSIYTLREKLIMIKISLIN